ncbi:MAG: NYN domain-containing protein [Desulfobulbaceae bacterium]|nr:NYN domain-containing protein [Desulfobulbaceae bacterium]
MSKPQILPASLRIAVFYDGTFFDKVSKYFKFYHQRASYINFNGLHEFIRDKIAESCSIDTSFCHVVESHFFRGRFSFTAAKNANALEKDRILDQHLMYAGILPHYYPMKETGDRAEEKGIDVWLSLEAYDLAVHKGFDLVVLFAGDQDFVPLLHKINAIGTRSMVIGADVEWEDNKGMRNWINTSQALINESSYTVMLNHEVDTRTVKNDPIIDAMFT